MVNRRWVRTSIFLVLAFVLLFTAACSNSNNGNNNTTNETQDNTTNETQDNTEKEQNNDSASQETNEPVDPLGKYDPPISFTAVRGTAEGVEFPEGETIEKNIWVTSYLEDLGIELTYDWLVNSNQFNEKLNVSIVSDDLPDFMEVDARQFQMLVEGEMLYDMTEVFDSYASDMAKGAFTETALEAATFQGKLMAIPSGGSSFDTAPLLWLRTDWLENLDLSVPTTMDELLNVIEAFVKDDPDGNNQDDTFGLTVNKDIFSSIGGLEGFFNGFHAYPYNKATMMWIEDGEGNLVYGGIQPEVKDALAALQELFAMGAIDREFGTQDPATAAESVLNGKTGAFFGPFNVPGWPLRNFKTQNPDADIRPFSIVSADGQTPLAIVPNPAPSRFYVVNKNSENPEALVKILNYYYEKIYSENNDMENFHTKVVGDKNYPVNTYAPVRGGMPENNQKAHYAVVDALKTSDTSKLNAEQQTYYDTILQYRDGDLSQYFRELMFGEEGAFSVLGVYKDKDSFQLNQFQGSPTMTWVELGSTLLDLEIQMLTRVIMGAPLDEFDDFVISWKQLGGDKITEEVNEWYALKK